MEVYKGGQFKHTFLSVLSLFLLNKLRSQTFTVSLYSVCLRSNINIQKLKLAEIRHRTVIEQEQYSCQLEVCSLKFHDEDLAS